MLRARAAAAGGWIRGAARHAAPQRALDPGVAAALRSARADASRCWHSLQDAEADLGAALAAAYRAPGGGGGSALDWAALALGSGGAFALSLEALVLTDDGSVLDALALAAKAALAHATLPQARPRAWLCPAFPLERSSIRCFPPAPHRCNAHACVLVLCPQLTAAAGEGEGAEWAVGDGVLRLDVAAVPLVVTVSRLGRRCVLDASAAEEAHCGAAQWAAVTARGDVSAAGSRRGGALPAGAAIDMLAAARKAGVALHVALDERLRCELAAAANA